MTDSDAATAPGREPASREGRRGRAVARRYGFALLMTASALGLTLLVAPVGQRSVFLFFFTAVVSSAWFGGLGPGLVATLLSVAAASYFFIPPIHGLSPVHRAEQVALGVFAALSIMVSSLSASLRAARHRAEGASAAATRLAAQLEQRARELEQQVEESRSLAEELAQTNGQLGDAAAEAEEASAAAAAAERRVTSILDSIGDAFVAFDRSWRFAYINCSAEQTLRSVGHEPGQLLGQVLWEAVPALVGTEFERAARRAAAEQVMVEHEVGFAPLDRWYQVRIYPGADGVSTYTRDVTERREAEEAQRLLLDTARLLSSSLDLDTTLRELTGIFVPRFADYCLVYLTTRDGVAHQAACRHADPAKHGLLEELGERWHPDLSNLASPTVRALRTTRPVLRPATSFEEARSFTDDPAVISILRRLAPVSYMVVPLVARGEAIGTVTLASSDSGRRYTASDLALVELLGGRAALALDNARLYAEAQQARDRAVRASQLEILLAKAKLDVLRAQLNPHFLFNTLNTIAMLVRRDADAEALRGILSLSTLLRQVLDGDGSAEVVLGDELSLVERYLEIEQLRFRDRLQVELSIEAEALEARVPTMLLQPLVENAIRHGVGRKAGAGRIEIGARCRERTLRIEVRDDGPGFPPDRDPATIHGVGLANTRERLRQLYGDHHRIEMRNSSSGGAVVVVEIPYSRTPRVAAPAADITAREERTPDATHPNVGGR